MITHLDDILHPLRILGKVGSSVYNVMTMFASAGPTFYFLSCTGSIIIESRKNGAIIRRNYGNLEQVSVSVEADANTPIKIIGNVTEIAVSGDILTDIDVTNCENLTMLMAQGSTFEHIDLTQNEHLQYLDLLYNSTLRELDVTNNPELIDLSLATNTHITSLDLSQNPALYSIGINALPNLGNLDLSNNTELHILALIDCTNMTTLDLSANPQLNNVNFTGSVNIDTIYVYSGNASVATGIANLITNATAADGTVYTNTAGANFATIKTAALAKGWTIRQLGSWLTDTTQQAILTTFGDTDGAAVIAATDDYLNTMAENDLDKAISLASYINEDPMLVCSLGLQPDGVTMPERKIIGDGNSYVRSGVVLDNNSELYAKFEFEGSNAGIFLGARRALSVDGFYLQKSLAGDIIAGYGTTNHPMVHEGTANTAHDFSLIKNKAKLDNITYDFSAQTFTSLEACVMGFNNNGTFSGAKLVAREFGIGSNGTLQRRYIPCKHNGESSFLDLLNVVFYPNDGSGQFTIPDIVYPH